MKERWLCVEGVTFDSGFCPKVKGAMEKADKTGEGNRKWCECPEGTHFTPVKDA